MCAVKKTKKSFPVTPAFAHLLYIVYGIEGIGRIIYISFLLHAFVEWFICAVLGDRASEANKRGL